jgi:hypothetical protein
MGSPLDASCTSRSRGYRSSGQLYGFIYPLSSLVRHKHLSGKSLPYKGAGCMPLLLLVFGLRGVESDTNLSRLGRCANIHRSAEKGCILGDRASGIDYSCKLGELEDKKRAGR